MWGSLRDTGTGTSRLSRSFFVRRFVELEPRADVLSPFDVSSLRTSALNSLYASIAEARLRFGFKWQTSLFSLHFKIKQIMQFYLAVMSAKKSGQLYDSHLDSDLNCLNLRHDQGAVWYINCSRSDHNLASVDSHTCRGISSNGSFSLGWKISCPTCSLASQLYRTHPLCVLWIFIVENIVQFFSYRMVELINWRKGWEQIGLNMKSSSNTKLLWASEEVIARIIRGLNLHLKAGGQFLKKNIFWNFESPIISNKLFMSDKSQSLYVKNHLIQTHIHRPLMTCLLTSSWWHSHSSFKKDIAQL